MYAGLSFRTTALARSDADRMWGSIIARIRNLE
jgi:hypothetical protein